MLKGFACSEMIFIFSLFVIGQVVFLSPVECSIGSVSCCFIGLGANLSDTDELLTIKFSGNLNNYTAFHLLRDVAVERGIIRDMDVFIEVCC